MRNYEVETVKSELLPTGAAEVVSRLSEEVRGHDMGAETGTGTW